MEVYCDRVCTLVVAVVAEVTDVNDDDYTVILYHLIVFVVVVVYI